MAIIALKAWYLDSYEPLRELEKRPYDLRLSQNSLLKSGLRADFLDDRDRVRESPWFLRYLEGETVEFYIEGSGGYVIANIDLTSQEIYFTKRDTSVLLEPTLFLSHQGEDVPSSVLLRATLTTLLTELNPQIRYPLRLVEASRPWADPLRLNHTLMRQIRQSLIFVADGTAIASAPSDREQPELLLPAKVVLEMGYALHGKKWEQVLLVQGPRPDLVGDYPLDLPSPQWLRYGDAAELAGILRDRLVWQLQRLQVFSEARFA